MDGSKKQVTAHLIRFISVILCLGSRGLQAKTLDNNEAAISFERSGTWDGVGLMPWTTGWAFEVDDSRTWSVTHLGIYNWDNNPEVDQERQIGVWDYYSDKAEAPLIEVTLQKGENKAVLGDSSNGNFLYVALDSPMDLSPGKYTIGAWSPDNSPSAIYNTADENIGTLSGLSFSSTTLGSELEGFHKPVHSAEFGASFSTNRPNGTFGPNLRFANTLSALAEMSVPAPGTSGLVLVGLSCLFIRRIRAWGRLNWFTKSGASQTQA